MVKLTILLIWVTCGVIAYGLMFSYFQDNWKEFAWPARKTDRSLAVFVFLMGVAGLILSYLLYDKGRPRLRFRAVSAEESWRAHKCKYPRLSREDWLS